MPNYRTRIRGKRRKRVHPNNLVYRIPMKFDKQFLAYLSDPRKEKELQKTVRSSRVLSWFMDLLSPTTFMDEDMYFKFGTFSIMSII